MKNGTRLFSPLLSCFFLIESAAAAERTTRSVKPLQVGFVVSKKSTPLAVDRNRLKRLTREVYRNNNGKLAACVEEKNVLVKLVLMVIVNEQTEIRRISYAQLQESWTSLLADLVKRIGETK